MTTLVHGLLEESARRTPDATALIETARTVTYDELDRLANRFAHLFRANGVTHGERVVVALENSVNTVAAYLGVMKAGGVAVPLAPGPRNGRLPLAVADSRPRVAVIDAATARAFAAAGAEAPALRTEAPALRTEALVLRTTADDLPRSAGTGLPWSAGTLVPASPASALRTTADGLPWSAGTLVPASSAPASSASSPQASPPPRVFVMGADLASALDECPDTALEVQVADTDLAAIIYTSGSTGEPRGVMLSHRNFTANARSIVSYLQLTAADRVMCVLPFSYVYGLSLLHTHLAVGGSLVIDNRFTYPNVVLDAMRRHRVTGFAGVPSSFALLLHRSNLADMDFPDLRYVTQAGGGMPAARIQEWLDRGPKAAFYVMYGATEAAARLTYLPPGRLKDKLGSIGRPIPGVEIVVLNDKGETAAPNEAGELVARGENISRGYWNRPDETAERFGPLGYRTGDLGYADGDGFLYLVGRLHDMIKVGAHRVGAREIEDVLNEHPDVTEAAVVPVPHDILGEVPVAFVSLRSDLADASMALRAFCGTRLASYKVPVRVDVLAELPRLSAAGKVDRKALRERAPAGSLAGGGA